MTTQTQPPIRAHLPEDPCQPQSSGCSCRWGSSVDASAWDASARSAMAVILPDRSSPLHGSSRAVRPQIVPASRSEQAGLLSSPACNLDTSRPEPYARMNPWILPPPAARDR